MSQNPEQEELNQNNADESVNIDPELNDIIQDFVNNAEVEQIPTCQHVFARGPRQGQTCPNTVCRNSTTLCRTHNNARRRAQRRRNGRQNANAPSPVNMLDNFTLPVFELPQINNRRQRLRSRLLFSEDEELLYKSCSMCNSRVEGAKVILECNCHYHLNCYQLVQYDENCLNCGDKINKKEEDYNDCSICLEKLKTRKVKIGCGHEFHRNCINSWMRIGRGENTHKCPNCRSNIR